MTNPSLEPYTKRTFSIICRKCHDQGSMSMVTKGDPPSGNIALEPVIVQCKHCWRPIAVQVAMRDHEYFATVVG